MFDQSGLAISTGFPDPRADMRTEARSRDAGSHDPRIEERRARQARSNTGPEGQEINQAGGPSLSVDPQAALGGNGGLAFAALLQAATNSQAGNQTGAAVDGPAQTAVANDGTDAVTGSVDGNLAAISMAPPVQNALVVSSTANISQQALESQTGTVQAALTTASAKVSAQVAAQAGTQVAAKTPEGTPGTDSQNSDMPISDLPLEGFQSLLSETTPSGFEAQIKAQAQNIQSLLQGRTLRAWGNGAETAAPAASNAGVAAASNPVAAQANAQANAFGAQNQAIGVETGAQSATSGDSSGQASASAVQNAINAAAPTAVEQRHEKQVAAREAAPIATTPTSATPVSGDAAVMGGETAPVLDTSANSTTTQPGHRADAPRIPAAHLPLLAATMARRLENGNREFTMRLDPAELGQIQVKLEMLADKKVRAVIAAEKPEGLAELQRSARDLEQALQDAGLELGENGLEFTLDMGAGQSDRQPQHQEAQGLSFADRQSRERDAASAETAAATNQPTIRQTGTHDIWKRTRVSLSA